MAKLKHYTGLRLTACALLSLSVISCGSGGGSNPIAPTPSDATVASTEPVSWQSATDAVDASTIDAVRLVIGDANGIFLNFEKGSFPADETHLIASASKWLSALVIHRLIEQGVMQAEDHPQKYLSYWSSDPADSRSKVTLRQLLAFTSGFNRGSNSACVEDRSTALQDCAESIYQSGLAAEPGSEFSYGPTHLHIAAAMAEVASGLGYSELFEQSLVMGLSLSDKTRLQVPSRTNPRVAGGAQTSVNDQIKVLQALLNGGALTQTDAFYADGTAAPVVFDYRPPAVVNDWHYAQGAWRICEKQLWDESCSNTQVLTSPGAFGWTPWIDADRQYFGLIAVDDKSADSASLRSTELLRALLPLIEAQFDKGQ